MVERVIMKSNVKLQYNPVLVNVLAKLQEHHAFTLGNVKSALAVLMTWNGHGVLNAEHLGQMFQ